MKNKVLVTGADGFIGSHLVEMLVAKGYQVRALAQYNSFNNWGWLEDIECLSRVEVVTGDIRDPSFCKDIMKETECVFHLAALIAIPFSYKASYSYSETNINGTLNVCQAAKELGNIRVIHTSTSEVYGSAKFVPINESHPFQPQSPYSASKIGADAMAMSFYHSFDVPVTIARPFNTYGPRQSARAVIPSIISQIAAGAEKIKLGDLTPTRDFNYVTDTCRGFVQLFECKDSVGKSFNIGSNYEISIADTLDLIKKIMNSDVKFITDEERLRPKKSEVKRLWCDNTLISNLTGFSPKVSLSEGLRNTIDWFTQDHNLLKYKSSIFNK